MFRYKTALLLSFAGFIVFMILTSSQQEVKTPFHSTTELKEFQNSRAHLDSAQYFLGSIRCKGCHGYDTLHHSNIDENGLDINLYDDWESTMMALSAKDPLWRAKVSHEILVNPTHADELQTKCTSCHAPMGHFTATINGAQHYTLDDMLNDTLGLNGVACGGCHEIAKDSLGGLEYSGNIHYDTSLVEFGPFTNPLVGPMQLYTGFTPTHSVHMNTSKLCSPCHTLQTATADLSGNSTGNYFTEQATYHEWLNSKFNDTVVCQRCHMPQVSEPVIIANNILNLLPRSPFNKHKFMGGNISMLNLIKQNKIALSIDVSDEHFDRTIASTLNLLQTATLDMSMQTDSVTTDTLYLSVSLTNKAGHKFPSGYPSRRAFVQIAATSSTDTVFQSGMLNPNYEIVGQGMAVEKHHNIISDSNQVQIYEMIMGDVNGNITTVLERADVELKDNRLPPAGFSTSHYAYDTARIVGEALTDPDFNYSGITEGSGRDIVHYHIPLRGHTGAVNVSAAVYYQTIPPRWFNEMFAYSSTYIDSFKAMYQTADKSPVLIAHDSLTSVIIPSGITAISKDEWKVFPVPSFNGEVFVQNINQHFVSKLEIWDASGRKVKELMVGKNESQFSITLPDATGIYWLRIQCGAQSVVKKLVRE